MSRIADIKARLQPFLDGERQARELQQRVPNSHLFVGVAGIRYDGDPFDVLPGFHTFRSLINQPDIFHVCRAAADLSQTDYLGVARYAGGMNAELGVGCRDRQGDDEPVFLHSLARHTAALLKLRGHDLLTCPASSTVSWDTVAAIDNHSVHFRVLDDVPRQITLNRRVTSVVGADLEWVRENWNRALLLRDASNSRRFGLAFNIAYTWNHTADARIAIGNLWCGLDALFGVQTDRPATKRLVERLASWLPGTDEQVIYKLYDHRCDAVHGRWMSNEELGSVLQETLSLLRRSLIRCIEGDIKTLPDWNG